MIFKEIQKIFLQSLFTWHGLNKHKTCCNYCKTAKKMISLGVAKWD